MLSALTQSLLQFMALFVVGAVMASACCLFSRVVNLDIPGCAGFIGLACVLLTGMFLSPPVLAAAIFCIPGAFARKAIQRTRTSVFVHYLDLLTTTLLSIAMGTVVAYFSTSSLWELCGLFLGLASTPSAFPTFRWIWRTSKTRPGIDRHLNSFDEINQPR
ncbi:hypothetical protein IAD21_00097 [Abditibacteriota bacterium]|nr:hypothetical protein IAD21_00097 [Abditibacteriota bacterium]